MPTITTLLSTCAWILRWASRAADILNSWTIDSLTELFGVYGEERYARRIARAVVERRRLFPSATRAVGGATSGNTDAGAGSAPAIRPAAFFRHFASRVNDELNSLRRALPEAFALLKAEECWRYKLPFSGRPYRQGILQRAGKMCTCTPEFPVCVCGGTARGDSSRKVLTPTARELS